MKSTKIETDAFCVLFLSCVVNMGIILNMQASQAVRLILMISIMMDNII